MPDYHLPAPGPMKTKTTTYEYRGWVATLFRSTSGYGHWFIRSLRDPNGAEMDDAAKIAHSITFRNGYGQVRNNPFGSEAGAQSHIRQAVDYLSLTPEERAEFDRKAAEWRPF